MNNLDKNITDFFRVSLLYSKKLEKVGLKTARDLLLYFPHRYDDFSSRINIADLKPNATATIQGRIVDIGNRRSWRNRRMVLTEAVVEDETGSIRVVWFNQPYLIRGLRKGLTLSLAGKTTIDNQGLVLSNPAFELFKINETLSHTGRIVPIYRETEGITSKWLRLHIQPLLEYAGEFEEFLPDDILKSEKLLNYTRAIKEIHFPSSVRLATEAKRRLAFDELLLIQLKVLQNRLKIQKEKSPAIKFDKELVKKFVDGLPFKLTDDQRRAAWEIIQDLEKPYQMNRLLEGDVGSGKTVVAAIAALETAKAGYQAAFMAPTEILADQHYRTFLEILEGQNVNTAILTGGKKIDSGGRGNDSAKQVLQKIRDGEIRIIIGTHALIQESVVFKNLALAIIDEQHRFGIKQRSALLRGTNAEQTRNNAEETLNNAEKTRNNAEETLNNAEKTRNNAELTQNYAEQTRNNAEETRNNAEETQENNKLLYENLTYKIRAALFDVKKELGSGHKEVVYQQAVADAFEKAGLNFSKEVKIPIFYRNKKVGVYIPDFVVENKIVVELKALTFTGQTEKKQIWSYLKGSQYRLALLANYGPKELTIDRIIYDTSRASASVPQSSASVPHLLSMTATPIPRTLALTLWGDLDISLLRQMPKGRRKIITKVVAPANLSKAHQFTREEIQKGRQAFIIYPLVEESPHLEAKAATAEYERLSREIFPDLRLGLLHGRMKPKEKEETMKKFKNKELDILISTSVVEVGIDVPNASVMIIEGADRFGLAQLHQFRGRVGRGEHQSYCFLFTDSAAKNTSRRLNALMTAASGFELAEKDLKIRGPGEFLGSKQSGLPDLAMASLNDVDLIKETREAARKILGNDPELKAHKLLREKLGEFSQKIHLE